MRRNDRSSPEQGAKLARLTSDPLVALALHAPWRPVDNARPEELGALQAVAHGTAESHQQTLAIEFILKICANGGAHFFPGEDGRRNTDFALGRAFVGQQIATFLRVKLNQGGGENG